MTRDERLAAGERILRAIFAVRAPEMDARDVVRHVVDAAYPELAAGTHWIAPREMTREMEGAVISAANREIEDTWSAARDAYLKQEGGG